MKKIISLILSLGLSLVALAQNVSVSGVVVDSDGQPIVGAFVVERGTTNGTMTDAQGAFTLRAAEGAALEVSCIGYASQNVTATSARALRIVLADDMEMLEETVVVGYGVRYECAEVLTFYDLKVRKILRLNYANLIAFVCKCFVEDCYGPCVAFADLVEVCKKSC